MSADLYLIPSSLGASQPETFLPHEVIKILHALPLFFAEDVRTARRFIKSTGFSGDLSSLTFYELSEHTSRREKEEYIQHLREVGKGGVISEAGLPGIADPGGALIHLCHQNDIRVHPLTGPSSIMLALMASGMNGQQFTFHGYLSRDPGKRRQQLRQLERESQLSGVSQLFMETPYRNMALIDDIMHTCKEATWLCIAAGLTTKGEFIKTKQIGSWKQQLPEIHKIPAIFILGKPE